MPDGALERSFISFVVTHKLWGESDLCLLDVGASGGIHTRWSDFADRLTAVGFDPLISEVDRLNAIETRSKIRYEAAYVGCDESNQAPERLDARTANRFNQLLERTSALAAHRILREDYVRTVYNAGAAVDYSSRTITLDDYLGSVPHLRPDFLKIDTDGGDYDVLRGATRLITGDSLLGVAVEVQFKGGENCFADIDHFLRQRGFTLFDLEAYRYSRAALPAVFAFGIPAQTVSGQVRWGEALFFRDLLDPVTEQHTATRERLLKLCCLFVAHGLNDCAAEILSSDVLSSVPERAALLDLLTPTLFGDTRYEDYIARFRANPLGWLPQNLPHHPEPAAAVAPIVPAAALLVAESTSADTDVSRDEREGQLRRDNAELVATVSRLKERIQRLKEQRAGLRNRLERCKNRLELLKASLSREDSE